MIDPVELALRSVQTAGLLAAHLVGPVRAVLECLDDGSLSVELDFNPESFSLTRRSPVSAGSGKRFAGLEPSGGTNDMLNFDVWLDASDVPTAVAAVAAIQAYTPNAVGMQDSILDKMEAMYALTVPRIPSDAAPTDLQGRVPVVAFIWGEFTFVGSITNLTYDVKLFDPVGNPRRARVSFSMEGRAFGPDDVATILHDTESIESFTDDFGIRRAAREGVTALKATALTVATRLV